MKPRSLPAWLVWFVPLLVVGPSIVVAVSQYRPASDPVIFYPSGDHAALELYTRLAARGHQSVGPYSRFGFHHPGPAYFYASVPAYELFSESYFGITLTALLINSLAICAILWVLRRDGGAVMFWAGACACAAFVAARGPEWLLATWNPKVAVLPFGAAFVALAAFAAGETRWLPLAVLAASFAVQTHAAPAAAVGVVALVALALHLPPLRRLAGLLDPPRRWSRGALVAAGVIAIVLWAPPLIEQLSPGGGNLGRLVAHSAEHRGEHSLGEAASAVSQGVASLLVADLGLVPSESPRAGTALVVSGALMVGLLLAHVLARRRADPFAAALSLMALAGTATGVVVARGISGPIFWYLVGWTSMLGLAAFVATAQAAALFCARDEGETDAARGVASRLAVAVVVLLSALNLHQAVAASRPGPDAARTAKRAERTRRLAADIRQALEADGIRRPLLRAEGDVAPATLGSIVLALDKRGVPVAVAPVGLLRIGGPFTPDGTEEAQVILSRGDVGLAGRAGAQLVARDGALRVYVLAGR